MSRLCKEESEPPFVSSPYCNIMFSRRNLSVLLREVDCLRRIAHASWRTAWPQKQNCVPADCTDDRDDLRRGSNPRCLSGEEQRRTARAATTYCTRPAAPSGVSCCASWSPARPRRPARLPRRPEKRRGGPVAERGRGAEAGSGAWIEGRLPAGIDGSGASSRRQGGTKSQAWPRGWQGAPAWGGKVVRWGGARWKATRPLPADRRWFFRGGSEHGQRVGRAWLWRHVAGPLEGGRS